MLDLRKATFTLNKAKGLQVTQFPDGTCVTFDRHLRQVQINLPGDFLVDFSGGQTVANLPGGTVVNYDHKKQVRTLILPIAGLRIKQRALGHGQTTVLLMFPDPNTEAGQVGEELKQSFDKEANAFRTYLPGGAIIEDSAVTPEMKIIVGQMEVVVRKDGSGLVIQLVEGFNIQVLPPTSSQVTITTDSFGNILEEYRNGGKLLVDKNGDAVRITIRRL